jgi:molecular chaperone DnaK
VLGRFRLENIRPAPRGVPQIEVTFDIDANGILSVSARDKDTGTEQRITITETSNLDQAEVGRMIADAERHREEDLRLRELTDARNELDAATYQVEHLLAERGEVLPVHVKARAENAASDARHALKEETSLDRLRNLTTELRQVTQELAAAGPGPQAGPGQQAGPGPAGGGDDDDVIDAEFTPTE